MFSVQSVIYIYIYCILLVKLTDENMKLAFVFSLKCGEYFEGDDDVEDQTAPLVIISVGRRLMYHFIQKIEDEMSVQFLLVLSN